MNELICSVCLENIGGLKKYINRYGYKDNCSFCGSKTKVVDKQLIIEHICNSIYMEYDTVENVLGRIDGEWVGDYKDSYDLVNDELGLRGVEVAEEIIDELGDNSWCEKDYYGMSDSEILLSSWSKFSKNVKFGSRFFFHNDSAHPYGEPFKINSKGILKQFKNSILNTGLISTIDIGSMIYRVRPCKKNDSFNTPEELGVPPNEAIKFSNRFSPPGIQMFYGSEDESTCLFEVNKPEYAFISKWKTLKKLYVLDLVSEFNFDSSGHFLKDFPDIFDEERRTLREQYLFLIDMANDFNKPIIQDGSENIDYVPTQIISEYLRRKVRTIKNKPINGIRFYSSKNEGVNYVLFLGPENCANGNKHQILKLDKVTKYKRPI